MKTVTLPVFILLFIFSASAQQAEQLKRVDQLLTGWNNSTPGVAVAIQLEDKVIYNKAFGLADLEHTIPNTTETIFESGSVAKQFTAMSILLLAADGKIALTDDIRKYVPEIPKYPTTITIQHLLNHTSGLKDWGSVGSLTGWPRSTRIYTQDLALQIMSRQKSTNFTPGSEYSYSNANYSLMVTIVERVSGQSLAVFTEQRLFKPLGMTNTQWRDNFREIVPNRSIAYRKQNGAYEQLMPFENIHGHGGLLTTTGDLLKWNQLLENHSIGGDKVYNWRVQRGKLTNGKEISYAGGLFIGKVDGFYEISHSGATAGYRAWLAYYPKKKLSIVALSNDASFNPGSIGWQLADIFLGTPKDDRPFSRVEAGTPDIVFDDIPLSDTDLKKFEGTYRSIRHYDVQKLEIKNGKILSKDKIIFASHRDTLYYEKTKWISSKPGKMLMINGTDTLSFVKTSSPDMSAASLAALAGEYKSEEADATYLVEIKNNEVWINIKPFPPYKLTPSFKDGFFSEDWDLYEFKRDKKGKVVRLMVSTGRAENVPFLRR